MGRVHREKFGNITANGGWEEGNITPNGGGLIRGRGLTKMPLEKSGLGINRIIWLRARLDG